MAGDKAPLTPDQGAETPIMCALLPAGSPTGGFWKENDWYIKNSTMLSRVIFTTYIDFSLIEFGVIIFLIVPVYVNGAHQYFFLGGL